MRPNYARLSRSPERVDEFAALVRSIPEDLPPLAVSPEVGVATIEVGGVEVTECGEPLVELRGHVLINAYRATAWPGTADRMWVRQGVHERLDAAAAILPGGFGLAIFDGWRSRVTIGALYDHYYGPGSTLTPGFLADPADDAIVPPHLTGGAVDLTLTWRGTPLSLGTPFDDFTPRAHLAALEADPDTEPSCSLRRLLHTVTAGAGFASNALEWWHVSFGDQAWAATSGASTAHYGASAP